MNRILPIVIAFFALVSCSPSLKSTMAVPFVPEPAAGKAAKAGITVALDEVRDARTSDALALYGQRSIPPEGQVAPAVRSALESALRRDGITISDSAPLVLTVEIRKWVSNVRSGVPSTADTEAELFVKVFDPANKMIYSGTYSGTASQSSTSLGEPEVRSTLGMAMSEAINQLASDSQLVNLLASF